MPGPGSTRTDTQRPGTVSEVAVSALARSPASVVGDLDLFHVDFNESVGSPIDVANRLDQRHIIDQYGQVLG